MHGWRGLPSIAGERASVWGPTPVAAGEPNGERDPKLLHSPSFYAVSENRFGPQGPTRVQIPPPPFFTGETAGFPHGPPSLRGRRDFARCGCGRRSRPPP